MQLKYKEIRNVQFQKMKEMIDLMVPKDETAVILGDLNFNAREEIQPLNSSESQLIHEP